MLFASFLKILGPIMLCLPAIIALHMVPELGLEADPETGRVPQDQVYPAMVRLVLPEASLGLFAAVLVGAILSSFNSALNSAATLFSLGFYQRYIKKEATHIPTKLPFATKTSAESEKALVTRLPRALDPRAPKISIHDLAL